MKLTAELTAEEIVTNLLSSHEILKRSKENFYISNSNSLGEYLKNLPSEELMREQIGAEKGKYTFIKEGGWKF